MNGMKAVIVSESDSSRTVRFDESADERAARIAAAAELVGAALRATPGQLHRLRRAAHARDLTRDLRRLGARVRWLS